VKRLWLLAVLPLLAACTPYLHLHELGIHEPIVSGGQAQIDQGEVTFLYGNLLAAHRTTHGAEFRNLPAIQVGYEFFTTGFLGASVQKWRVVAKRTTASNSASRIAGWPLVLQTSVPGGRLLVFCERA